MSHESFEKPALVVVAGPIGSGKTTFYDAHLRGLFPTMVPGLLKDQQKMLATERSFATEDITVDLGLLKEAKNAGYASKVMFISTEDPALNVGRVMVRMSQGGPAISFSAVIQSYADAHENLKLASSRADDMFFFDNSPDGRGQRSLAHFTDGELVKLSDDLPHWFQNIFSKEIAHFQERDRKASGKPRSH